MADISSLDPHGSNQSQPQILVEEKIFSPDQHVVEKNSEDIFGNGRPPRGSDKIFHPDQHVVENSSEDIFSNGRPPRGSENFSDAVEHKEEYKSSEDILGTHRPQAFGSTFQPDEMDFVWENDFVPVPSIRRRRPPRSDNQRRRPNRRMKRVMLCGIDDVPHQVIASRLARLRLGIERGRINLKPDQSGSGIILTHPQADKLLDANIDDRLFGTQRRFRVQKMRDTNLSLFVPSLPQNLTNNDLLEVLPGVYRIRRLKNQSKAFVSVVSDEARALLLRDGVMINNHPIVFEVPKPYACRSCFSTEHRSCSKKLCGTCQGADHLRDMCPRHDHPTCGFCKAHDHTMAKCPGYQKWQEEGQQAELERLLGLIPSLEESLDDPRPPQQVLTRRQQKIFDEGQSKSSMSYADIVTSRIARRHKKKKNKKQRQPSHQPSRNSRKAPEPSQTPTLTDRPGPVEAVMSRLKLSGMPPEHLPALQKDLSELLERSLQNWIDQMTIELQARCDEFIKLEAQKVSRKLAENHASRLDTGMWTIQCKCGSSFHMSQAEEHLKTCTLDQHQTPERPIVHEVVDIMDIEEEKIDALPLTVEPEVPPMMPPIVLHQRKRSRPQSPPASSDPEVDLEVKTDDNGESLEPTTAHRRKLSNQRITPDGVRQMKLSSMFQSAARKPTIVELAVSTPVSDSEIPSSEDSDVDHDLDDPSNPLSARKSVFEHSAERRQ